MLLHTIPPIYNSKSKFLILGSFPSKTSRENQFFYAHQQNRFWKVLAAVFKDKLPKTIDEKKSFLLKHYTALWDVVASCDIEGSSDMSITNAAANDLTDILNTSKISKIFVNGRTAENLYKKHIEEKTGLKAIYLPSTSPANASWTLERLIKAWECLV